MSVWNRVAAMEKARLQRNGGYRVWFAPGTAPKTGVALVVSNRLAGAKVEVLYRDLTGHTLIATCAQGYLERVPKYVMRNTPDAVKEIPGGT